MSYVDAVLDSKADKIYVVERTPEGTRAYKELPTNYVFYYEDPKGKYQSIYGDRVSRFSTRKKAEFEKEWKEKQEKQSQEKNPIKEANKLARLTKEAVLPPAKPTRPKAIKPKAKTSVCRTGQTQTGMQTKNGMSVPKCSVK